MLLNIILIDEIIQMKRPADGKTFTISRQTEITFKLSVRDCTRIHYKNKAITKADGHEKVTRN